MKESSAKNDLDLKESKTSLLDSYNSIMQGFDPIRLINSPWEKRGDCYVQYSAFDQNVICTSGISAKHSAKL
jgi:hypothetical protein